MKIFVLAKDGGKAYENVWTLKHDPVSGEYVVVDYDDKVLMRYPNGSIDSVYIYKEDNNG